MLSSSPTVMTGALIEFSQRIIGPVPNVIVFQFNPETLTRNLDVWIPPKIGEEEGEVENAEACAMAQPSDPKETFTLKISLEGTDMPGPVSQGIAEVVGVAAQISALEMLLYPDEGGGVLGGLVASVSASIGGLSIGGSAATEPVPRRNVPVTLFFWGPGRIVPVRVTSFSVEEQAFSPLLYPIRAMATLGLQVLRPDELECSENAAAIEVAKGAFEFTKKQKQVLAATNIANSAESVLGKLPI